MSYNNPDTEIQHMSQMRNDFHNEETRTILVRIDKASQ